MPESRKPRLVRVSGRPEWHAYWRDGPRRHRVSTGTQDRAEAERVLAELAATLDRAASGPVRGISGLLESYLTDRRDAGRLGAERLAWAHKPLRRFWGERPPEAVTAAECRRYARERARDASGPHGKPAGAATVRTELQALRAALRWAAAEKLIAEAPAVPLPGRPPARDRWLTREEVERLLAACERPHIRLFIQLAVRTAARAGAVLSLTWDRVDLEHGRIDYRVPGRAETRKRRVPVPINEVLAAELAAARAARTSEWVVEWAGGRVLSVKHGLRQTAARAGLRGVTPHVLRHTAATWMAQAGVPLWEIAGFLGHSDATMVAQVYGHHSPEHMRAAARALS